jgi:hypothetical protein
VTAVSWVGDSATLTLSSGVKNNFLASETKVAATIVKTNVKSFVDGVVKSFSTSTYDDTAYPILTNAIGTVEETITLTMTSATAFSAISDWRGVLPNGSRSVDYAPINTDFNQEYFRLSAAGWGGVGAIGETFTFVLHPCAVGLWASHCVEPNSAGGGDFVHIAVRTEA